MAVHALTIGCNYPRTSSELAGCVNDARDWADELGSRKAVASVSKIENKRATRKYGHEVARRLLASLQPGDWAWLWFSGHGTVQEDTNGDEPTGFDQAIVWNDFRLDFDDEFAGMLAGRANADTTNVFAGLDCCHSKSMTRAMVRRAIKGIPFSRCQTHARVSNTVAPRALPGVILFAGCGDGPTEYSFDAEFPGANGKPRPNGAFTYHALRTLRELEAGATFREWFQKIGGRRPKGALPTTEYPQQPAFQASDAMMRRPIPIL